MQLSLKTFVRFTSCALTVAVVGSSLTVAPVATLFGAAAAGSAAGAALSYYLDKRYA